jgi:non-canonical poly(A) RNA polymerase PAPD5/7
MADAYRPRKQPARDRPPPLADRITFGADNGNNSRPANHNGDIAAGYQEFTFSSGNGAPQFPPTGPSSERNTRRTRGGAPGKYNERHYGRGVDSTSYQNGRNNAGASRRGNYRKPPAAHERALLQSRDDTTEQSFVTYGSNKFNLDNISVDEELDQDSDADDSDDAAVGGGVRKVARVHSKVSADGDSVPKWSNPDPYTVLPPPETAKRVDVVKLIRKAKNDAAEQNNNGNAVAANDDFISFMPDDQLEAPLNDLPDPALIPTATPQKSNGRRKRVRDEVGVAKEWQTTRIGNTPWVKNGYEHLKQNPAKW